MKDKFSIIKGRVLTEKSVKDAEFGKLHFYVDPRATKNEIKRFVETFFKAKVEKVNIINLPKKKKRFKNIEGFRKRRVKSIVTLKEGEEIKEL